MKILIVYIRNSKKTRNTINESIDAFKKYSNEDIYYLNIIKGIPNIVFRIKFDLVIFHYTSLIFKFFTEERVSTFKSRFSKLAKLNGLKIAIPQDEYVNSIALCRMLKVWGVNIIFTCLPEEEWEKVYPEKESGVKIFKTVLTGYIDELAINRCKKYYLPHSERLIDICYRARRYPYWLGSFAQLKSTITDVFSKATLNTTLKTDLSNNSEDVFFGEDWYKFLSNSRVSLGCEGGASLHDPTGEIRKRVDDYCEKNPEADYYEVESQVFPGMDGNLNLKALSPRHFEVCLTKTTQVLYKGEYNGILKPGIHYIEIKEGFSNIQEVIDKISNIELCEKIAEQAYQDIVVNGKYTYRDYITEIIYFSKQYLKSNAACQENQNQLINEFYLMKFFYHVKYYIIYSLIILAHKLYLKIDGILSKYMKKDKYNKLKNKIKKIANYIMNKTNYISIGG